MACSVDAEYALQPCDDFVRGWVGGFIEVDDAGGDVGFEIAAERCAAGWDWGEVAGSDEYCEVKSVYARKYIYIYVQRARCSEQKSLDCGITYIDPSSAATVATRWYQVSARCSQA